MKVGNPKEKLQKVNREEKLREEFGDKYFGNPYNKDLTDFWDDKEDNEMNNENYDGHLIFMQNNPDQGGGYSLTTSDKLKEDDSLSDTIFISHDAEFAYRFFDAMKELEQIESDQNKLYSLATVMAKAIPKGIKKRNLSKEDLKEIQNLKNKLYSYSANIK